MNRFKKIMTLACLGLLITSQQDLTARQQEPMGANPYTYAPQYFQAEDGVTGRYWAGNKKYPGKAYIDDIEFKNIVVIKENQLATKQNKKLRKNKEYLGFYIDAQTNLQYNLYGVKKNPDPVDDGPDSDVLTVIAIKQDTGIGE